jgi:Na+-transporting NADH:ubiquinone oxidoreductase subunit NqrF
MYVVPDVAENVSESKVVPDLVSYINPRGVVSVNMRIAPPPPPPPLFPVAPVTAGDPAPPAPPAPPI